MIGRPWRKPLLAAVLVAIGVWLTPPPPAVLASDGACPGSTGVTVVVDFQALGGGVVTRCAPGTPTSGFKALTAAGFSIAEVQNVPGFLCRISGKPTPSRDSCVNTPPASAYWSYWHAPRGGAWVTSQEGGKTRIPPVGSVDGWSFSDDGSLGAAPPPGVAPPAMPKPPTPKPVTPKPATPKPVTPKPTASAPATPAASIDEAPSDAPSSSDAALVEPTTSAGMTADPTPMTAGDASATASGAGSDAAAASTSDPPLGTLLGIALVMVIGGAALFVSRRRTPGGAGG